MWLEFYTRNNEDIFKDIVDEEIADRLIKYIGIDKNYIRSQIYWELGLGFKPYLDLKEPACSIVFNVIEEHLRSLKKHTIWHERLSEIENATDDVLSLMSKSNISELIQPDLNEAEIKQFIELGNKILFKTKALNRNYNQNYKLHNENWGTLGYYKKYLTHCANVYMKLSPQKFTISFSRGSKKGDWIEHSPASKFLREFHNITNKMLIAINSKPFSDSNFKSTCEEIRSDYRNNKSIK